MPTIIIGIAGPSGGGKTTLATMLKEAIEARFPGSCRIGSMDCWYKGQELMEPGVTYDNPRAIDIPMFNFQLEALLRGEAIDVPYYDFGTHSRIEGAKTTTLNPKEFKFLILEGIFLFHDEAVRNLMSFKISVMADVETTCKKRRFKRDAEERGRDEPSMMAQWLEVREGYDTFVAKTLQYADYFVDNNADSREALIAQLPSIMEAMRRRNLLAEDQPSQVTNLLLHSVLYSPAVLSSAAAPAPSLEGGAPCV
jgi:uridine kinase